jgi:hypothetical protein
MFNHPSSKAVIILSVEDVYRRVIQQFKNELPVAWFDNNEVNEIITTIFNGTISSILYNIGAKSLNNYKECYQGNIDYLEYCGLSQEISFQIVHICEMGILKSIFDACPFLDDEKILTIIDFKYMFMIDLHIIVEFKEPNIYEQNTNHTHRRYSKIL